MSVLTQSIYDRLAGDTTLTDLLATYQDEPAIFTTDPAPGDASRPYIVTAGEVTQSPFDTKNSRGRRAYRDVRCYTDADGAALDTIEVIAERVRTLLHRYRLDIEGFGVLAAECGGPVAADEEGAYGRILTVQYLLTEV